MEMVLHCSQAAQSYGASAPTLQPEYQCWVSQMFCESKQEVLHHPVGAPAFSGEEVSTEWHGMWGGLRKGIWGVFLGKGRVEMSECERGA